MLFRSTYAQEKKWINATLSFIGSFPGIGEAIRDGGLLANFLLKISKNEKYLKHVKTVLKHSNKIVSMINKGLKLFIENKGKIETFLIALSKSKDKRIQKYITPYVNDILKSVDEVEKNFKEIDKKIKDSKEDPKEESEENAEESDKEKLNESLRVILKEQRRLLAESTVRRPKK